MPAHPRPYYYLENFRVALDWLDSRYRELLSQEERKFLSEFERLPVEAAALLVRMITRQGHHFRTTRLRYPEIGCPHRAAAPLIDLGWTDPRPSLSPKQLCRLLTKPELWSLLGLHGRARAARKSALPELLASLDAESKPLDAWWPGARDEILHVAIAPLCERLRLMFFGNFRQNWSEFVLADLGIFRYETVPLDASARAFQSREQIEQFHALFRVRELLHDDASLEIALASLPDALPGCSWIEARRSKLLFAIAQRYEQSGDLHKALDLYLDCRHNQARVRAIRVLERLDRPAQAAELLASAQTSPTSEREAQHLARILPRLHRKLGTPVRRARSRIGWESFELELPRDDTLGSVEHIVAHHLGTPQSPVIYVENALINSLFGLLCWEAIFAPVPGAFFHMFHAAPADLLDVDFRKRRAAYFDSCFSLLARGEHGAAILDTFERKSGIQSPFVAWGLLTRELLELALACMPAAHLQKCFERLLSDIPSNRSGLPDLIQFWPRERAYRLIEVKGPGDRLQDNQIRWLTFCSAHAMPVSVCKVRWQECSP